MTVRFLDLEESSNPLNGTRIDDKGELLKLLDGLRGRHPFLCQLAGDNGYMLMMGIGGPVGCVQHSPTNGDTPYLLAVSNAERDTDGEDVEFLAGGTPTPISPRNGFPFESVKQIAVYFLETGNRMPSISWEEI
ncbi:MAG TPA: Imm1 family immunity protein [Candidatus Angelobacter sp.]|nr:Imm1 family immunity protein [Candidatus Angelobacter sp.]